MTLPPAPIPSSTQMDRIAAIVVVFGYLAGLIYFLDRSASETTLNYYTAAGFILILPLTVYLLARENLFARNVSELTSKLARVESNTNAVVRQTNGAFSAQLNSQTEAIVARVVAELSAVSVPAVITVDKPDSLAVDSDHGTTT